MKTHEERRKYIVEKFTEIVMTMYDGNGTFIGSYDQPDDRDRMRSAAALLAQGGEEQQRLAEQLIMQVFNEDGVDYTLASLEENLVDPLKALTLDWNIFQSNDGAYVLAVYGDRLSDEVRQKLERIALRNAARCAGSAQADYIFHGFNDNMPAHGLSGLILGGEAIGNQQAIDDGVYRLEFFAEMLSRRGKASEYSSANYLPLTICSMAKVAEYSKSPEIRELAKKVEQQLWCDVSLHYHIPSSRNAASQSRAYTWNSVGHVDTMGCAFWVASGYPKHYNPVDFAYHLKENQVTHFAGDPLKSFGDIISSITHYHFPGYLIEALENRTYPYQFTSTAETGGDNGGENRAITWQTKDYAIASSLASYGSCKQTEVFYATYCQKENPIDFSETGSIYTRFLINDDQPGLPGDAGGEAGLCPNTGLMRAVQKENTVLLVSKGVSLSGEALKLNAIRQSVIIPAHFFDAEECWLGDQQVDGFTSGSETVKPIFINLGRAYLALYPLTMTNLGRNVAIRLEKINRYQVVSFINYEGDEREFSAEDFSEVFNGFIVDISGPDESGTFADFRKNWEKGKVEDWWFAGNRRTRLIRENSELLINWLTEHDVLRSGVIDGREVDRIPLAATGFDSTNVQLLNEPYVSRAVNPPEELDVVWYPDMKWQINQ